MEKLQSLSSVAGTGCKGTYGRNLKYSGIQSYMTSEVDLVMPFAKYNSTASSRSLMSNRGPGRVLTDIGWDWSEIHGC